MTRLPAWLIVVVMLASLVGASLLRGYAMDRRADAGSGAALARLDSFALGLLLGGLRGPLVMTLWSSTESQKTSRDMQDFDTRVELIRLLQPEFDSVHLYQIWNKAYNASATRANLSGKYQTILDAVRYGQEVAAERPDNINLQTAVGEIFFQKLGKLEIEPYLAERARLETLPDVGQVKLSFPEADLPAVADAARAAGVPAERLFPQRVDGDTLSVLLRRDVADAVLPTLESAIEPQKLVVAERRPPEDEARMPPLLDADGNLLPLAELPDDALDVLRPLGPFPEGVPPGALAYAYYLDALRLQQEANQRHTQLSERVISRNPALAVRQWAQSLYVRGRLYEIEALGLPVPAQVQAYGLDTAGLPPEPREPTPLLTRAAWAYERAAALMAEAEREYLAHLDRHPSDAGRYAQHLSFVRAMRSFLRADAAYLLLVQTDDDAQRRELAAAAARGYADASMRSARIVARHYTTPDLLAQVGLGDLAGVDDQSIPPAQAVAAADLSLRVAQDSPAGVYEYELEASEFGIYRKRAGDRLAALLDAGLVGESDLALPE